MEIKCNFKMYFTLLFIPWHNNKLNLFGISVKIYFFEFSNFYLLHAHWKQANLRVAMTGEKCGKIMFLYLNHCTKYFINHWGHWFGSRIRQSLYHIGIAFYNVHCTIFICSALLYLECQSQTHSLPHLKTT